MTITLPDELKPTLERNAAAGGYASIDAYVADLVTDDAGETFPGERPQFTTRTELEQLLDEGMASGVAGRMDEAFWKEQRQFLEAKVRERAGRTK